MLLLVSFLSVSAFSQDLSLRSIDLWNNIDWSLNLLEQDQNNMKQYIDQQEKQIESLENAYLDQQRLYLDLENNYTKLEKDTKKWKTCSIVLGTLGLTLAGVLIIREVTK